MPPGLTLSPPLPYLALTTCLFHCISVLPLVALCPANPASAPCIRAIGGLHSLTSLYFESTACNDTGFCALASLINLQELSLCDSHVTDVALSSFSTLVNLAELRLSSTSITGVGFHALSSLTVLEALELDGCDNLTNEGVLVLAVTFKALHDLTLAGCTQLTSIAWSYLAQHASPYLINLDVYGFELTDADLKVLDRFNVIPY